MIPWNWKPLDDRYEASKLEGQMAFYDRVQAEKEDILSALKTQVRCWTEETMDKGDDPLLSDFLAIYPEWDHDQLHGFITKERDRVESIILRDREEMETSH